MSADEVFKQLTERLIQLDKEDYCSTVRIIRHDPEGNHLGVHISRP